MIGLNEIVGAGGGREIISPFLEKEGWETGPCRKHGMVGGDGEYSGVSTQLSSARGGPLPGIEPGSPAL